MPAICCVVRLPWWYYVDLALVAQWLANVIASTPLVYCLISVQCGDMLMSCFWLREVYLALFVPVKVLPCRHCWQSYITTFTIIHRQSVFVGVLLHGGPTL